MVSEPLERAVLLIYCTAAVYHIQYISYLSYTSIRTYLYLYILNVLYHIEAITAASDTSGSASSSSNTDEYTAQLVAVIVVSSAYGLVMIVLVGAYHLFLQPLSVGMGRGAGARKKRVPAKDKDASLDAVPSEQCTSPIEQVFIRGPFKSSVESEAQKDEQLIAVISDQWIFMQY